MENHPQASPIDILADLILIHAPSVFDFRDRDDMLFAYLSDSDSVNITSVFEMFPIGFFAIQQKLQSEGLRCEIVNFASLMLMHPKIDVDRLLSHLQAPVFGIDLHWMPHCHGSIELAKRIKAIHPDSLVIFGGISATYYANELIEYDPVDAVIKGYDTLLPVSQFIRAVLQGKRDFRAIPNLVYKKPGAEIIDTGFSYKPDNNYNDIAIDWSFYKSATTNLKTSKLIMTLPNAGCAMDCPWCGGSRSAFRKVMGRNKTLVQKNNQHILAELRSMGASAKDTSIYALQCYSETVSRMYEYLRGVAEMGYKSVSIEQFDLPDQPMLEMMGRSSKVYICLSPESHDLEISKLAGRGRFSMQQMEEWIPRAFEAGIAGIMVWFFIGMPRQTPQSVMDTVAYCENLLHKYPYFVIPLICPMVPFLDPGSRFFEHPDAHGYRIFHQSLEEHRQAMVEPLWYKRLNYETIWMSRREIQNVTYEAIEQLVKIKADLGLLPSSIAQRVVETIDETRNLIHEIEHCMQMQDYLSPGLRLVIQAYNRKILAYSSDQIIPSPRPFGGRWFDDYTVSSEIVSQSIVS